MVATPRRPRAQRLFVAAVVVALLLGACHGSTKHKASSTTAVPTTDKKGKPSVSLSLRAGSLHVQSAGPTRPFSHTLAKQLLELVNRYIATGITRPLFTGASASGLAQFFTPRVAPRVGIGQPDRRALTDEKVPKMTVVSKVVEQPFVLQGLEDRTGKLVMAGGQIGIYVKGTTAQGPLTISRLGNFIFEPGPGGKWFISGYSLYARRDTGSTTTTTKASTTTAAP